MSQLAENPTSRASYTNQRAHYLPLIWKEFNPGDHPFQFVKKFDKAVTGPSGKFQFGRRGVFNEIDEGLKLIVGLEDLYNEIGVTNEPQNTAVLFPTISVDAFAKRCIWDYYTIPPLNVTHDCYTMPMSNVDFTKPHPQNFNTPHFTQENCYNVTDSSTQKPAEGCELPLAPFLFHNSEFILA